MDKEEIERRLTKLEKENRRLKELVRDRSVKSKNTEDSTGKLVSRRDFLKKLGAGAIGIGALATPVASKMTISSNGIYKGGSKAFLGLSGAKTVSTNLDMSSNDIKNVKRITVSEREIGNYGLKAYLSSNQTISNDTLTKLSLDSTVFDDENEFDSSNSKIVVSDSGKYRIYAQVFYASLGVDGRSIIQIELNGGRVAGGVNSGDSGGSVTTHTETVEELSSGDEIVINTKQKSGDSIDARSGSDVTFLTFTKEA